MANRLKGITLEIGGDTTKLSSALSGVNKEIKNTQTQLKDVEKLLKLDPTNVDLLKQRQALLTKEVEQTKTKLQQLKDAQKNMDANGVDKNSEQYQALQREIIDCEQALGRLERAAAQSNATLSAVGAAASKISSGAKKVAQATKKISMAAGAGIAAIGVAGYNSAKQADEYNTTAKQTGLSTDTLQKMTYAADLLDVSYETVTGSVSKMTAKLRTNEEAFTDLGISTRDASGELRSTEDIMMDSFKALSKIENETERDIAAQELFGKSAAELAGYIDDGGKAFRELGDQAEKAGLIMSQNTLDALNAVNDTIDTIKATAKATLAETGAKALEALMPVIEKLVDVIGRVLEYIGSLSPETIQLMVTILAIVAAISPIASIIAGISGAISALTPIISAIIAFCAANPVVLAITAIVIAVAAAVYLIVTHWEEIKAFFIQVAETIQQKYEELKSKISEFFTAAGESIQETWENVKTVVSNVADAIRQAFDTAVGAIIGKFEAWKGAIEGVIQKVRELAGSIGGKVSGFIGGLGIPGFASGGSLTHGAAFVGENGPELLTVNGGRATVTPLTAQVDTKGLSAALSGNMATNVNIEFTGSLSQLARILQPAINAETTRVGASLIKG